MCGKVCKKTGEGVQTPPPIRTRVEAKNRFFRVKRLNFGHQIAQNLFNFVKERAKKLPTSGRFGRGPKNMMAGLGGGAAALNASPLDPLV